MTEDIKCPNCNSTRIVKKENLDHGRARYVCKQCTQAGDKQVTFTFPMWNDVHFKTKMNGTGVISGRIPRAYEEEDIIKHFKIDTEQWEIISIEYGEYEGYRKDRKVDWLVKDGEVKYGEVHDSGKMRIEPLVSVKVTIRRRVHELRMSTRINDLMADAKKHSYRYPKIKYPKISKNSGLLYEIDFPDLHFGKLAWAEETGQDYDIKIAAEVARNAIHDLLTRIKSFPVSKILLPLGNDFLNVNGAGEQTVNGTKQQEDTRWQKTFRNGRKLLVELIELCSGIAPVDVLIISGNHDRERMFYMGDAIECWFHNSPNVKVDNSARYRKFYTHGKSLIVFSHGDDDKLHNIVGNVAIEEPILWGNAKHREYHMGHLHHKKDLVFKTNETQGLVIRYLRSLTPLDEWHYRNGFMGARQAAESFLWHPEHGVIGQFTSI